MKFFIIALILSLPLWWGINALSSNLEDFWFGQELLKKPELFTAELNQKIIDQKIEELKLNRELRENFQDLELSSKAAVSVRIDRRGNEFFLFEENSEEKLPIASLTKLMTALIVFDLGEAYRPEQMIAITKEAVEQEGWSKYQNLKIGEKISIENLLYIMLIESSNDAAFALTQPIGEKAFVDLMNIYAKNLSLENTYFVNPTGLEPDNIGEDINYSTAKDLVKLANHILKKHPDIFKITSNRSALILNPDGSIHHFIAQNTNELLGEIKGVIGGKTGWAPRAGECLLLVLDDPESSSYFINVVLGSSDRFSEMRKLWQRLQ